MSISTDGLRTLDDPEHVRRAADDVVAVVARIHRRSESVRRTWQGLSACYTAPEEDVVLAAMDPPEQHAEAFLAQARRIRTALHHYAEELRELARERADLVARAEAYNADLALFEARTSGTWERIGLELGMFGEADLMNRGQAIQDDIDAWTARVDTAQRDCANAIRGEFRAAPLKAADRASVQDVQAGRVHGLSADGYEARTQAGDSPWFDPFSWNGKSVNGAMKAVADGLGACLADTGHQLKVLFGAGEPGEWDAMKGGLQSLGSALAVRAGSVFAWPVEQTAADRERLAAADETIEQAARSAVSWDTWGSTGYRTAGGLLPDAAGAVGGVGAARIGLRSAVRSAHRAMSRTAPVTATRISRLAGAVDAMQRTGRLNRGLTAIRDAGYRAQDLASAVHRGSVEVPRRAVRSAYRALEGRGPGWGAAPQLAGVPGGRVPRRGPEWLHTWMEKGPRGAPGTGGSVWQPVGDVQEYLRRRLPPVRQESRVTLAGGQERFVDSEMKVRPDVVPSRTVEVDVSGEHRHLMPGARTRFGEGQVLDPHTAYHVRGRGTFITDAEGTVDFVVVDRSLLSRKGWVTVPDLRRPLPDTTYVTNGAYYHTDHLGRTDHVYLDRVVLADGKPIRSRAAQRRIAGGVADHDAGHLIAAQTRGAPEEINLVQMVSAFNRGWEGRSLRGGDSWRHLEHAIRRAVQDGHEVTFEIRARYVESASRPEFFHVSARTKSGVDLAEMRMDNA